MNWPLVAFRARFATVSMVEGDDPAGRRAVSMARLTVKHECCLVTEKEERNAHGTSISALMLIKGSLVLTIHM